MEYLPGGSLAEFVADKEVSIGCHLKLRFCIEIASGLAYFHNLEPKRLIHGDLKAENVLLTEALHCKIADFGSSVASSYTGRQTTPGCSQQQSEYTPIYAAPELLLDPATKKTPAIDTYSFSIIIYVVLKREVPISSKEVEDLYIQSIINGQRPKTLFTSDLSEDFSGRGFAVVKNLETIMKQCWSHSPSERPSMVDVHQHLVQIQAKVDVNKVAKEVAIALDKVTITIPVQSNYQCAPLNMFHPPSFQLFQPGK